MWTIDRNTLVWLVLFGAILVSAGCEGPSPKQDETFRTLFETVEATAHSDQHGVPVDAEATVVYYDPEWNMAYVSDDSVSMFVSVQGGIDVKPGDRVRLTGESAASNVGVADPTFEFIGHPGLPPASQHRIAELPSAVGTWTEISGIGRFAGMYMGRHSFILADGGEIARVIVQDPTFGGIDQYVDARVTVRGIPTPHHDADGSIIESWFFVSSLHDVQIEEPAPPHHLIPILSIGDLRHTPSPVLPENRIRIIGTVEDWVPGVSLTIGDESGRIQIPTSHRRPITVGDRVEVTGFPAVDSLGPVLAFADFRKTEAEPGRTAVAREATRRLPLSTGRELLSLSLSETDRRMPVQITGVVTYADVPWTMLYVQDETAGVFVSVETEKMPLDQRATFEALAPGDLVEVRGSTGRGQYGPILDRKSVV